MMLKRLPVPIFLLVLLSFLSPCEAQQATPLPAATPPPPKTESQDRVKVFTEEVVIPVTAYDNSGHLSAALEPEDILVFEDDVRQTVRSVRRIPANVLLLLDTGGGLNPAMSTSLTRDIATRLVSNLRDGDRIAAIQFGGREEKIQDWTIDRQAVLRTLKWKLRSNNRSMLVRALISAAAELREQPAGARHLVMITDGVDALGKTEALTKAVTQLLDSNITVHVLAYTAMGRTKIDKQNPLVRITNDKRKSAREIAEDLLHPGDAARVEGMRKSTIYVIVDTDFEMRRVRNAYKEETRESERWLSALAEETGGLIFIPRSPEEMLSRGEEIAREIDSQYVVTYTPKRPLAEAAAEEYRALKVASSVSGMKVRARRGYVAKAQ